jgi:hypothetical protein
MRRTRPEETSDDSRNKIPGRRGPGVRLIYSRQGEKPLRG